MQVKGARGECADRKQNPHLRKLYQPENRKTRLTADNTSPTNRKTLFTSVGNIDTGTSLGNTESPVLLLVSGYSASVSSSSV